MQYKMTQCWYPDLKTIEDHRGRRTVMDGNPKPLQAPVQFDRILQFDRGFILMQKGFDENALFAWGRKEAIELEEVKKN